MTDLVEQPAAEKNPSVSTASNPARLTSRKPRNQDIAFANAPPLLVPIKEAGRRLGLGRTKIYQLIGTGDLAAVRIGRARRISVASISALAARLLGEVAQ